MIIEITTRAVSRRIAHLEAVKRDLGITDTSADDAILQAIDIASGEFARLMGREPWMQTYQVRQAGDGGAYLRLPVWPLVSVSELADITWADGVETFTAIDTDDWEIEGDATAADRRDRIYRVEGFATSAPKSPTRHSSEERTLLYRTTCVAGWATPIDDWTADTLVRVGEYARSSDRTVALRFEATTVAGDGKTHASTEPTWPTAAGDTVVDDQVTWTAREAIEMPRNLWAAAMWAAKAIYSDPDLMAAQPAGIKSMAGGGLRAEWFGQGNGGSGSPILPVLSSQIAEAYAS